MDEQAKTDFFNSLWIVLVIYKMRISESSAYRSLTAALLHSKKSTSLFIYDNSPVRQESLTDQCWNAQYRHDPSNPGVSKAYNEGFKKAKELNKKWLLLVDQDTVFPENCFDSYYKCICEFETQVVVPVLKDKIGIASPFKFYFGGGQRVFNLDSNKEMSLRDFCFHNSGLLISVDQFEKAGMYDEQLPLDFSDLSFVYRLRRSNTSFAITDFLCAHKLATSDSSPQEERLKRFISYVSSSKRFKSKYAPSDWMLSLRVFLRSIKLSLRYRSFKFIMSFLKA